MKTLKEHSTLSELTQKHQLHPNQISLWKQAFIQQSASVFEQKNSVNGLNHRLKPSEPLRAVQEAMARSATLDDIYIERFCRTTKYQYIYPHLIGDLLELFLGIRMWIDKYRYRKQQRTNLQKPQDLFKPVASISTKKLTFLA